MWCQCPALARLTPPHPRRPEPAHGGPTTSEERAGDTETVEVSLTLNCKGPFWSSFAILFQCFLLNINIAQKK